jgi:hypothetical protein
MPRYKLRMLMIQLTATVVVAVETLCAIHYAKPTAEAASDYVIEIAYRAIYRGSCGMTLE